MYARKSYATAFAGLVLAMTAAVSAHAQAPAPAAPAAPAPAPADFATQKATMLSRIDQRVASMTTMRNCVSAASTDADLKTCRTQAKAEHKGRHQKG